MRILITGACGFAGSVLAKGLAEAGFELHGLDNFSRPGSEINRLPLRRLGIHLHHGDVRAASDFEHLPKMDWVIDAAANPSVLAGVDGRTSGRQLVEQNLYGTVNLLECCRQWQAGFILLSTSRVYSIAALRDLPLDRAGPAFRPLTGVALPPGAAAAGLTEQFSVTPPVSLYGATKLASELLALEYGATHGLPVWINRCGVLAGAGQFGRPDQGIFSYWIHSHRARRPLKYIGFGGTGRQVRDCLHPRDIVPLLATQMQAGRGEGRARVVHVSGGAASATSLCELTTWCDQRFGQHAVAAEPKERAFDIPWLVLDPALAQATWNWRPQTSAADIFEEIARHAEENPGWLDLSAS